MKTFVLALTMLPVLAMGQTLDECQQAAERNYPLIRQYGLIEKTTALTNVDYHIGPGKGFKKLGVVSEGKTVTYTTILDGWMYIPSLKGWSMTKYYKM